MLLKLQIWENRTWGIFKSFERCDMFAHLISSLSRIAGGLFYSVSGFVKSQRILGADAQVWGLEDKYLNQDRHQWGAIPLNNFRIFGPKAIGYAPGFFSSLDNAEPKLTHLHGIWMYPSRVTELWQRKTGRPTIISPHGMLNPISLHSSAWKKWLALRFYEKHNLERCACFHALSHFEAESIKAFNLKQPIAVIPNGVDLPDISANEKVIRDSRPRTLLFLGRFHSIKNLDSLIQAWKSLPVSRTSEWRLIMAGWGDATYQKRLNDLAGKSVTFIGSLYGDEKIKAFQEASAFVLPSFSEASPMAVLEAWSYGLPVLMSRECRLSEGFSKGAAIETGLTPSEISTALECFFHMDDLEREKMGLNGRELVKERFAWPIVASKMLKIYDWILGKGQKPEFVID